MFLLAGCFCFIAGLAQDETPKPTAKPQQTFEVDSVHSTSLFRVQHLGAGMFYGRFNDVTGTIKYAPGSETDLSFNIEIDVNSVDTGNSNLDGHLKSPDFFNSVEFASMHFSSRSAKLVKPDVYRVEGDLKIHGVSRPITVDIEQTGLAAGKRGERVGFETVFEIKRSEFGMEYGLGENGIGDSTRVIVSLEAIAQ
jgi:polyisoprenoid-binding protein YceI